MNTEQLINKSKQARELIVQMANKSKSGHIGGSLSCVEILTVLYDNFLKESDKFIMSKGHDCMALYATLVIKGILPAEYLDSYHINGGKLLGHPVKGIQGIEWSSGSLGHGLSIGIGYAIAKKLKKESGYIYILLGDGECNEGSIWEAAMFATQQKLDNLVAIVDCNRHQGIDRYVNVDPKGYLSAKWESFGWRTQQIDGHDIVDISGALYNRGPEPFVILAQTTKGKGILSFEDTTESHYRYPKDEELEQILKDIRNA